MTERHHSTELEREFELERVMLFSDAVFAIAITLLVIEVKWPELPESMEGVQWDKLLGPTVFSFVGFVLSFVFIGHFWTCHLRLFKLLRKYDRGLLTRNLLFLFFIVIFPFTAAGLFGHLRVGFILPLYVYLGNLVMVSAAHFILCRYTLNSKKYLATEGKKEEKKYIYLQTRNATFAMAATVVVVGIANLIFPEKVAPYSCAFSGVFLMLGNKLAAKHEPPSLS